MKTENTIDFAKVVEILSRYKITVTPCDSVFTKDVIKAAYTKTLPLSIFQNNRDYAKLLSLYLIEFLLDVGKNLKTLPTNVTAVKCQETNFFTFEETVLDEKAVLKISICMFIPKINESTNAIRILDF